MRTPRAASWLVPIVLGLAACGAPPGSGSSTSTEVIPTPIPIGRVAGSVMAGPVCPVETNPPTPGCEDRAVPGAVIVVTRSDGSAVAEVTSDAAGRFVLELPPGGYVLTPQPVEGLLGTAPPARVVVTAGVTTEAVLSYDTGIRGPAGA